jgi:Glycosyl hydrolase family 26
VGRGVARPIAFTSAPRPVRKTLAAIALILGLLALPSSAPAARQAFGIHTPGDPYGATTHRVDALQQDLGRRIRIVSWFQNWGGDQWVRSVQPPVFNAVTGPGRRPLVAWEPWVPGGGTWQSQYALSQINGGAFDDYIASWARGLRKVHGPVYVRLMHEMNGNWYPWAGTVNGNSPKVFRAAWRRVVRIFRKQGAHNVRFVWAPITEDLPHTKANRFERYYPGRKYVDVLALDGYNWGADFPQNGGWRSFRTTFMRAYRRLAKLGRQRIWITEVGSSSVGGDKAAWVRGMFRTARTMHRLRAIVWMDTHSPGEGDWRARFPAGTASAFRAKT